MTDFIIATLTPIETRHAGLAVATARAGGVALLDAERWPPAASADADDNLRSLIGQAPPNAVIGLRVRHSRLEALGPLLATLSTRRHWIVVAGWSASPDESMLVDLPAAANREVWLEVSSDGELERVRAAGGTIHGVLLRGLECGGWVHGDPAFILAQRAAAAGLTVPFLVQGGIGLHTAAAARAAGAAGVVLDDQLWLMPESPLPARWQRLLNGVDGTEALTLGDDLEMSLRVFRRRGLQGAHDLEQLADALQRDGRDADASRRAWEHEANARVGWGDPSVMAWPMGQAVGLAAAFRDRFHTTGRLIRAIRDASRDHLTSAVQHRALTPGSSLARSHGTRFPVVQGPMTRVSDTAAFAEAVADAGALPMLALALMDETQTRELLEATRARLGDRPWGVGILGFVPTDRREEQLRAIDAVRPAFALIAGGRPDQATALARHGVATYLHVPVPGLLRLFLDQGARRFVFEGRECGGHIGPLSSFTLWESMVQTLIDHAPAGERDQIHVIFAGGIHDALSAGMVSALAAPLAARGMHIGVLLGSSYLFTSEAVSTGAISQAFQDQAIRCTRTVELTTGLGHVLRCAPTAFADEFRATRRQLIQDGASVETIRRTLDDLGLGRARIAAKGLARGHAGALTAVDVERQLQDGMFMMGRLATIRADVCTIEALHTAVTEGAQQVVERAARAGRAPASRAPGRPAEVAVIGIGCLLPGAQDPQSFWRNVLRKTSAITEIPKHRFDWRIMYSPDRKAPDKIISKWGAFFDEVPFDSLRYGIPPNSMKSLSTSQLLALEVTRWALEDAGYGDGEFDRENTAVIVGTGANGDLEQHFMIRSTLPLFVEHLSDDDLKRLPTWTEESFAGVLANVTAGRIANRFDLGGANYSVDAACASSLTVIDLALSELTTGRSNMVMAVGLDFEQTPYFYHGFTRVQAFSPSGEVKTFDQDANGIVMGEGAVVLALKRLADAERDGDRIYGVIQSAAGSSDGKGLGMTAPRSIGQQRAVRRAYEEAGCSMAQIGLYEAHGTGTAVGDRAETETLIKSLRDAGAEPHSCVVGSVKTLVGHTKAAAGMVGLLKALMALHYRTLPPHSNVERPLAPLTEPDTPAVLLREPRPWFVANDEPRRAGVSAFGFGGTNFHAVIEEYRGAVATPAGEHHWPWELIVIRADGPADLTAELERLAAVLRHPAVPRLADLACSLALRAEERRSCASVLSLVADSPDHLAQTVSTILGRLSANAGDPVGPLGHLSWHAGTAAPPIAFLFPGQGAQAPNMGRDAAIYLPELRSAIERLDRVTEGCFDGPASRAIFPPSAFADEQAQHQAGRVNDTHVAQPAIGALSLGYLGVMRRLGLTASMVAGHSYGELTALHAAGVLGADDFLRLSEIRGRLMSATDAGSMLAVALPSEDVARYLDGVADVVIANRNAPRQTVISGATDPVALVAARLAAAGIPARQLPVSGAFHSPLMASVERPFLDAIASCPMVGPRIPVYGNAGGAPYPDDAKGTQERLGDHLRSAVDFVGQVRRMYADGARCFVELGPGAALTGMVGAILGDQPHTAVSLGGGGTLKSVLDGIARMLSAGIDVDLGTLFEGGRASQVDLDHLQEAVRPSTLWMIDGGRVRRPNEEFGTTGELPLLDLEAIEARKAARSAQAPPPAAARLGVPDDPLPAARATAGPGALAASVPLGPARNGNHAGTPPALEAYHAYQETMRHFLSLQERVMAQVLGQPTAADGAGDGRPLVDAIASSSRSEPAIRDAFAPPPAVLIPAATGHEESLPKPEPVTASAAPGSMAITELSEGTAPEMVINREQLTDRVLALIGDRTGYPVDMLGPDQDLEAELGVDSIKRMEILDSLRRQLPASLREAADSHMEDLVRQSTVAGWVTTVLSWSTNGKSAPPPIPTVEPPLRTAPPENGCPRWVMQAREEELSDGVATIPTGLFLITEDRLGVAPKLADALRSHNVPVALLAVDTLGSFDAVERQVRDLTERHGPVQGLVHLAALNTADGTNNLDRWRHRTQTEVKSLFELLRLTAPDLHARAGDGGACVLGATVLGGTWGRTNGGGPGSPASGGIYGLVKTLSTEYPSVNARVVDFDTSLQPDQIADRLQRELLSRTGAFEVGYPKGKRTVFVPAAVPHGPVNDNPDLMPKAGWVVLVTGGARGITAEIAMRLAAPGVRLIVVGRTAHPGDEDPQMAGLTDTAALRRHFLGRAKAAAEPLTPAAIERRVNAVVKAREIRRNLSALTERGAEVEYVAADVRDPDSLGAIIERIYGRYGAIHAVLHGAGVIEDKLLPDKSRESFERVFDTKADSTFLLSRALRPEQLRWVVLMSSISGRIGNRGQIDYAAANEVMNRLAWAMARQLPSTRVLSINWGPWRGAGMTTDDVLPQLEARGIRAIEPDAGWRFLHDELTTGAHDVVEVIAGDGV